MTALRRTFYSIEKKRFDYDKLADEWKSSIIFCVFEGIQCLLIEERWLESSLDRTIEPTSVFTGSVYPRLKVINRDYRLLAGK